MKKLSKFFGFGTGSKYGNKKVTVDGITFDSKKEAERWMVLKEAEKAGEISDLQRQVKFELIPAVREQYEEQLKTKTVTRTRTTQLAVRYTADFVYKKGEELVVEDVKSSPIIVNNDKGYCLRKKMMYAFKGIKIKEVFKANEEV